MGRRESCHGRFGGSALLPRPPPLRVLVPKGALTSDDGVTLDNGPLLGPAESAIPCWAFARNVSERTIHLMEWRAIFHAAIRFRGDAPRF